VVECLPSKNVAEFKPHYYPKEKEKERESGRKEIGEKEKKKKPRNND
jgi:hypothetical protein